MSENVAPDQVVAVLLTDGWHDVVPGSFSVGSLGFGVGTDPGVPGFRFAEAEAGRPYQPTVLAGPLDSVIAVRQVIPAMPRADHQERALAAHNGQRAGQGARLQLRTGR